MSPLPRKQGSDPSPAETAAAHDALWNRGLSIRSEVVGSPHVTRSLDTATAFSQPMQDYATEVGWGWIWARPGLDRKQRSMINLAMLCAAGKSQELGVHVRGAVRNGLTEVEIRETLLQAAGYAGFPAGMEGFRVAERVLDEMESNGELPDGWRQKDA
jgi:4-carboxymuconolactone decarboxylase